MFWTRLSSGVILLAIAIASMAAGDALLAGILLVISLIAYRELTRALQVNTKEKGFNVPEVIGFAGIICYYLTIYLRLGDTMQLMCIAGAFLAEMFAYVFCFPRYDYKQIVSSVFALLYAPVMLSFVYLTRELSYGQYMVWLILISSWGCDTCAYCVGMLIGKKKIFPLLSPKKSLEGCIGGALGAALLGGVYSLLVVDKVIAHQNVVWILAFICGAAGIMSMVGDLAASAIKRNVGIKDYGRLIPGHGGIMDRFDSMIVTAPVIYFLTILMIQL